MWFVITPTSFVAILLTSVIVILTYFKWKFSYWSKKGVVTLPPSIPFGNAADLMLLRKSIGEVFKDAYDKFKPKGYKYFGYYMSLEPSLIIVDPELIKNILTRDFVHFTDHGAYINEKLDPLTGGLFALEGLKWKNLRSKLTPTFTSGKMKMMFETMANCSGELINIMDKAADQKEAVEIKEIVARFTTDVIGSCAFGLECNSLKDPDAEFRKYGKKLFELRLLQFAKILISIISPQILDVLRIQIVPSDVRKFFSNVVKNTVDYRETNNVIRKDFMHLLIQLKNNVKIRDEEKVGDLKNNSTDNNVGKTLTMNEMTAQALLFFGAGYETSSNALNFCFYELAMNTDIQEKLRKEIDTVLEKHDGQITYSALMEMHYMDKCVNETLRKHPPVPALIRKCTEPYTIPNSNVTIDKDTRIFVSVLGIHGDPEYYPNPEQFDPERFSIENKAKRPNYTWLPFGEGPRICIGSRFALTQIKVALTVLIRRYRFYIHSKTKLPLTMNANSNSTNAKGGIWFSVDKI